MCIRDRFMVADDVENLEKLIGREKQRIKDKYCVFMDLIEKHRNNMSKVEDFLREKEEEMGVILRKLQTIDANLNDTVPVTKSGKAYPPNLKAFNAKDDQSLGQLPSNMESGIFGIQHLSSSKFGVHLQSARSQVMSVALNPNGDDNGTKAEHQNLDSFLSHKRTGYNDPEPKEYQMSSQRRGVANSNVPALSSLKLVNHAPLNEGKPYGCLLYTSPSPRDQA
eukprot:TRINITY_DN7934_c0_g2_i1.p1 TRINITY_DN7934_c0_g2~~TRINITY_DN7934_c0_g2_i1.p1  ORF type:complete len:223 (+),score=33.25 TRINITY_DN7934_c0_g2_i1:66-734(+)